MILGFDAKRLFHNTSGLGNYSRTLLQDLSTYYPENIYHLFTPSGANHPWLTGFLQSPFKVHIPANKTWWWRSWSLPNNFPVDMQLYHGLSHELPFTIHQTKVKRIVTIHDLIYRHFPQDFPRPDRIVYEQKIRYALKNADQVVAISEHTRRDLLNHFDVQADRIRVIYQAAHPLFRQTPSTDSIQTAKTKYNLPDHYLLYAGAISHRKNALLALQALQTHRHLDIPLVIVGRGKHYEQKCRQYVVDHRMQKQVIWLGHIPPDQVPALMKGAEAVIYPSLYEGFGLPVLESILLDIPVITTRESSLPEAGGELAHYVGGRDAGELAQMIEAVLQTKDSGDRNEQREKHLAQFNPAVLALQWNDLYQQVIED